MEAKKDAKFESKSRYSKRSNVRSLSPATCSGMIKNHDVAALRFATKVSGAKQRHE
jgi:hypothetical protein